MSKILLLDILPGCSQAKCQAASAAYDFGVRQHLTPRHKDCEIQIYIIIKEGTIVQDKMYIVEFRIEVSASSRMEALEIARDGVQLDYAEVTIDGTPG